jgi:hypothetical protein
MSVLAAGIVARLAPIVLKAGAPLLADLVRSQVGDTAGRVVEAIAGRLGVPPSPEAIVERHKAEPAAVEDAIRQVEAEAPQYWAALAQADLIRADLLKAEMKEPWWAWAWRPFWMWLLAALWIWTAVAVATGVPHIDFATMVWLTTAYLALYMGGHTVKDGIGKWVAARSGGQ